MEKDLAHSPPCQVGHPVIVDHQDHIEKMLSLHLEEDLAREEEEDLRLEVAIHQEEALVPEVHHHKLMGAAGIPAMEEVAIRLRE